MKLKSTKTTGHTLTHWLELENTVCTSGITMVWTLMILNKHRDPTPKPHGSIYDLSVVINLILIKNQRLRPNKWTVWETYANRKCFSGGWAKKYSGAVRPPDKMEMDTRYLFDTVMAGSEFLGWACTHIHTDGTHIHTDGVPKLSFSTLFPSLLGHLTPWSGSSAHSGTLWDLDSYMVGFWAVVEF